MHYIGEGVGDAVGVQISGQLAEVMPSWALVTESDQSQSASTWGHQAEKAVAWENMSAEVSCSVAVFQLPMFWLKAVASSNIPPMNCTKAVFQLPMSWLKPLTDRNMRYVEVTLAVFQLPMS